MLSLKISLLIFPGVDLPQVVLFIVQHAYLQQGLFKPTKEVVNLVQLKVVAVDQGMLPDTEFQGEKSQWSIGAGVLFELQGDPGTLFGGPGFVFLQQRPAAEVLIITWDNQGNVVLPFDDRAIAHEFTHKRLHKDVEDVACLKVLLVEDAAFFGAENRSKVFHSYTS